MFAGATDNQSLPGLPLKPLLIVLSGPSGAGKDAVLSRMKASGASLSFITTLTTRRRRPSEKSGVDYRFVSLRRFQDMIANNELLEWANVYGNWYGVPRRDVKEALGRGEDVVVKVDVQGAATLKKILPQALFLFLTPPSLAALFDRLKERHTESPVELERRLQAAAEEIKQSAMFDYVVVNHSDDIDRAVTEILAIIAAEKSRLSPRDISL